MRQRSYGRDRELTLRMAFTGFLLLLVYMAFGLLLLWAGIHPIFMVVLGVIMVAFQYFGSDKLVLLTTGSRAVTPEQEPRFHAMVERLAAMADMPKPKKLAVMETHVPNAFATGRNPKKAVIVVTRGASRSSGRGGAGGGVGPRAYPHQESGRDGPDLGRPYRDNGRLLSARQQALAGENLYGLFDR